MTIVHIYHYNPFTFFLYSDIISASGRKEGRTIMNTYFGKLERYPLGAIHAQGFLKEQMLRGKDGLAGHLYKLEPGMILAPYINKTHVDGWANFDQLGWGAEIAGNYWSGYIQYAFTLSDQEMIDIATEWVDKMLTRQCED